LTAAAEVAHFGFYDLAGMSPAWKIRNSKGRVIFRGTLPKMDIPTGNLIKLGVIRQPLGSITEPEKLTVTLEVGHFQNHWDIWIYPAKLPDLRGDVLVTQKLDARTLEFLNNGGNVLLTPIKGSLKAANGGDIAVGFSSIFWNTAWTGNQAPHTLGILCNPHHPALADFPTEYHSNWQWWDAMSHSNAIILSDFPAEIKPIVRIIDDWFTNRPLAMIFEANTGKGKIIVCGVDLLTTKDKRPEARQLLYSLQNYMESRNFNPTTFVGIEKIQKLF
jgi:hypothetical protein